MNANKPSVPSTSAAPLATREEWLTSVTPRRVPWYIDVVNVLGGYLSMFLGMAVLFFLPVLDVIGGRPAAIKADPLATPLTLLFFAFTGGVSLYCACLGLKVSLRGVWLLRRGAPGVATVTSCREPRGRRSAWQIELVFTAPDGSKHRTAVAVEDSRTAGRLNDELWEPVVYDPARPAKFVPLDSIAFHPRLAAHGRVVATGGPGFSRIFPPLIMAALGAAFISILVR